MSRIIFLVLLLLLSFAGPSRNTQSESALHFTFAEPEDEHPCIVLDEGGPELLITAAEPLTDVRVLQLQYVYDESTDREYFEVGAELFSGNWQQGDGLILESFIPDTIPNLYVAYVRADGNAEGRFLSQSGKDGSLQLLELDIPLQGS